MSKSSTRRGDIWQLGHSRIGCGDAANPDDIARLLDGATPGTVLTDPPYGMNEDPEHWSSAQGTLNPATPTPGNVYPKVVGDHRP
jgi:DNA modification methylase